MEAFRGPQSYTKQQSQFYPDISSGLFHMATFISSFTWSKLAKTRGASGRGNWNSTYIDDSNHYDNGDHSNDNVEGERSNLPWLGWGHIRPQASWSRPHVPSGQLVPFMVMMILQMMAIFAIIIIIIIFIAILLITIILPGMLKCNVEILLIVCKIFNNCFVRSIVDEGKVAGKKKHIYGEYEIMWWSSGHQKAHFNLVSIPISCSPCPWAWGAFGTFPLQPPFTLHCWWNYIGKIWYQYHTIPYQL